MKDPLEYLNDATIDLSEYNETPLNDIEKQKMKSNIRKTIKRNNKRSNKILKKVSGCVIATTICTLGFSICFPAYAERIPGLRNVVEFLNRNNEIEGYEENSVPVMASIKVEGYELNIESAYYNGMEVTLFYNVIGEEPLDKTKQYTFESKINFEKDVAYVSRLEYGEFIDDNTFAGMFTIYINPHDGNVLPKSFEGEIDFTKLLIGYDMSSEIEIDTEPIKLSLDIGNMEFNEYPINKEIIFNGNVIEVFSAKEYPTGIFIEDKNIVTDENININYRVWDSKKGCLKGISGKFNDDGNMCFKYSLPSKGSEVLLVPYAYSYSEHSNLGDEKVLIELKNSKYDFDKQGTFEILEINDTDDTTEIRIRATGNQVKEYFYFKGDSDDYYYEPLYEKDKKILGVLDMEVTYVFNKLNRENNYYLEVSSADFELLENQIIKVK